MSRNTFRLMLAAIAFLALLAVWAMPDQPVAFTMATGTDPVPGCHLGEILPAHIAVPAVDLNQVGHSKCSKPTRSRSALLSLSLGPGREVTAL